MSAFGTKRTWHGALDGFLGSAAMPIFFSC
jgi:hypothetical protein